MSDELNKQIAKLKNICWHEWENCQGDLPFGEKYYDGKRCKNQECIYNEGCYAVQPDNPNWENNISDAWGLFEELPFSRDYKVNKPYDEEFHSVTYYQGKKMGWSRSFEGKTAPEAICNAWITWMKIKK